MYFFIGVITHKKKVIAVYLALFCKKEENAKALLLFFMSFVVHSSSLELTAEEKLYAQEKAEKLLHFSKQAKTEESVEVKFEIEKYNGKDKLHQFICTITVHIPGKVLHAESYGTGVYSVIDDSVKKAEIQIKKEKEKHIHL